MNPRAVTFNLHTNIFNGLEFLVKRITIFQKRVERTTPYIECLFFRIREPAILDETVWGTTVFEITYPFPSPLPHTVYVVELT